MSHPRTLSFAAVSLVFLTVAVGSGCVPESGTKTRAQKDDASAELPVFGTEAESPENVRGMPQESFVGVSGTQEPIRMPRLRDEPTAVLPIVLELQSAISGRSIEVAYLISKTGEVSDCRVVRLAVPANCWGS